MRQWKTRQELDLEGRLRAHRPAPRPEFLHELVASIGAERRPLTPAALRLSLAGAVTCGLLVAAASFGSLGYAASATGDAARALWTTATFSRPAGPVRVTGLTSGGDQYRPGYGWGDPRHAHQGPPGLLLVSPHRDLRPHGALHRGPRFAGRGKYALVAARYLVDEQADLFISVQPVVCRRRAAVCTRSGARLSLVQSKTRVAGGTVSGAPTKTFRYRVLIPRILRLTLVVPASLLEQGKLYAIVITAVDPSGKRSRLEVGVTR
ncbi:MAG TPA: hypothetical protein VI409_04570 [Gaiellaceae bacterium]|nr:hypothetical protein [Gaiellaceae bacterium]